MSAVNAPMRSACAALNALHTAILCGTQRALPSREHATLACLLYLLCQQAHCAESAPMLTLPPAPLSQNFYSPATLAALPQSLALGDIVLPEERRFSPTAFSPRKPNCLDRLPVQRDEFSVTPQPLRQTNVWQRLRDYKSKDRVRLVTLWEGQNTSLSIQAGKHGDPSVQWTSRSLNRGGATRGLLDHLVALSIGSAAASLSNADRGGRSSVPLALGPAPQLPGKTIAAAVPRVP